MSLKRKNNLRQFRENDYWTFNMNFFNSGQPIMIRKKTGIYFYKKIIFLFSRRPATSERTWCKVWIGDIKRWSSWGSQHPGKFFDIILFNIDVYDLYILLRILRDDEQNNFFQRQKLISVERFVDLLLFSYRTSSWKIQKKSFFKWF